SRKIRRSGGAGENGLLRVLERKLLQVEHFPLRQETKGEEVLRERVRERRLHLEAASVLPARSITAGDVAGLVFRLPRLELTRQRVRVRAIGPFIAPASQAHV